MYIIATRDLSWAKVGLVSTAANVGRRRTALERANREPGSERYEPYGVLVVATFEGLTYVGPQAEANWHIAESLESAMRLVIAREVGKFTEHYEWLTPRAPSRRFPAGGWTEVVEKAWDEVAPLWKGI